MSTSLAGFNFFDAIFLTFTIIFVVTAFLRGFVKEIFSLFNWVMALTLSYLLTPYAAQLLERYSDNKLAIDVAARVIIFVLVFVITALSTSGLSSALKDKMPNAFDRSLGVFYGLVKTLLIFGFAYAITANLYGFLLGKKSSETKEKMPTWLVEAKSHSIIKLSGEALDPVVKAFFDAITKNFDHIIPTQETLDNKINEIIEKKIEDQKEADVDSKAEQKPADAGAGYNKKDIEKMNRLIDIVQ